MLALRSRTERHAPQRSGAYLVEFSLVVPVFAVFMIGIMEFGHAYLVVATINAAAKEGARMGAIEGTTTAQVTSRVEQVVAAAIRTNDVTVQVKDGSVFDTSSPANNTVDYATLPDLELSTANERHLFIVRIEVPYNSVALLPPFWVKDFTLTSISVMRHE